MRSNGASVSRSFWFVAFAFSVNMAGTTLPTPLYPLYQKALGLDPLAITLVFAIYAIGVIAGLMMFGRLSDAIGRKRVLRAALLLSLASAVAFALAKGLPAIYLARVLSGFSAGIFTGSGTAYLVELAAPELRARAATLAVAANMGGLGLGTLLSGMLGQYAPFPSQLSFLVDAGLVVLALIALSLAPETVDATGTFQCGCRSCDPPEVRAVFVPAAIAGTCGFAVAGLLSAVAPSYLSRVIGQTNHAHAGLLVFALMGMTALGQIVVRRFERRRALQIGTALLLAGVGLLGIGVALHAEWLFFAAAIVDGFGQGLGIGSGLAEINARLTHARGEVGSAYFVLIYLGLAFPVVGVGVVADVAASTRGGDLLLVVAIAGRSVGAQLRPQDFSERGKLRTDDTCAFMRRPSEPPSTARSPRPPLSRSPPVRTPRLRRRDRERPPGHREVIGVFIQHRGAILSGHGQRHEGASRQMQLHQINIVDANRDNA